MKIIKNIIYFIQIRHTDDVPSTGTRLVCCNSQSVPVHTNMLSAKYSITLLREKMQSFIKVFGKF